MPDSEQYRQKRLDVASDLYPQLVMYQVNTGNFCSIENTAKLAVSYADLLIQVNEEHPTPLPTAPSKPMPPLL